jgi:hypothetical protein
MPRERQQRRNRLKRVHLFKAHTPFLPEEDDRIERWGISESHPQSRGRGVHPHAQGS